MDNYGTTFSSRKPDLNQFNVLETIPVPKYPKIPPDMLKMG